MHIRLTIAGVDGETNVAMDCISSKAAFQFLQQHDHEGSSIGLVLDVDEPGDVWAMLLAVKETEEVHARNAQ